MVVLENESAENSVTKPYLKELTQMGAYLSDYHGVRHPSQPNYIAMVSGSTHHVTDDSNVMLVAEHLGDLLETRGKSWKNYAEGYPGGCNLAARIGKYVRKHVPFLSFNNIQADPGRCARHVVPATEFDRDVSAGTLPEFSLYTPDMDNDGHDTSVGFADQWLRKRFGEWLKNPEFLRDTLFVVTFDEGTYFSSNRVYTVLLGSAVRPGVRVSTKYNHYNLLRTIEEALGTGTLEFNDRDARPIDGVWLNPE